jgi:hypothetical protein
MKGFAVIVLTAVAPENGSDMHQATRLSALLPSQQSGGERERK